MDSAMSFGYYFNQIRYWQGRPKRQKDDEVIIVEGEHCVFTALEKKIECIAIFSVVQQEEFDKSYRELSSKIINFFHCPFEKLKTISELGTPSIIGVFVRPPQAGDINFNDDMVLLDALQDAGNVGTIMRTANSLGIKQIVSTFGGVSLWHTKVIRAGQGAHFNIKIFEDMSYSDLEKNINIKTRPNLYVATMDGKTMFEANLKPKGIWVFGNEGQGVNQNILNLAHKKISIPMPSGFESLNVALSAGVLFYEQFRQRNY